jgi:hypothetical protein
MEERSVRKPPKLAGKLPDASKDARVRVPS